MSAAPALAGIGPAATLIINDTTESPTVSFSNFIGLQICDTNGANCSASAIFGTNVPVPEAFTFKGSFLNHSRLTGLEVIGVFTEPDSSVLSDVFDFTASGTAVSPQGLPGTLSFTGCFWSDGDTGEGAPAFCPGSGGVPETADGITVILGDIPLTLTVISDVVDTPEPASLALLGTGLLGLAAARRRKAA